VRREKRGKSPYFATINPLEKRKKKPRPKKTPAEEGREKISLLLSPPWGRYRKSPSHTANPVVLAEKEGKKREKPLHLLQGRWTA